MFINKLLMLEARSFELLSLQSNKQAIFKNVKHYIKSNVENTAIIPIHGILTKNTEAFDDVLGMTSYEKIQEQIEQAVNDKEIERIVLDIDSPGGEVNGLFDLADFIYGARKLKSIVAIANDDAYSAAYAIASSAEKVLISRTSGVGSIGVIASHIDQSGFDEKQGIKYTTVFAGSRKNDLNPHEPINSEGLSSLQEEVNRLYEIFVQLIARNRNLSEEIIKNTEAGLYFGEKAIEIGLADEITTLNEFINKGEKTMTERPQAAQVKLEQPKRIEPKIEQTKGKTEQIKPKKSYEKYRSDVLEISKLCKLSKMPERLVNFVEQGVSVKKAREILMSILAKRTTKSEIVSTLPQNSTKDLMLKVARARRNRKV